jgi:hypothetical protein
MFSRIRAFAAMLAMLIGAATGCTDDDVARWKGASQGTIVAALDMPAADMLRQSTKPMSKFAGGMSDNYSGTGFFDFQLAHTPIRFHDCSMYSIGVDRSDHRVTSINMFLTKGPHKWPALVREANEVQRLLLHDGWTPMSKGDQSLDVWLRQDPDSIGTTPSDVTGTFDWIKSGQEFRLSVHRKWDAATFWLSFDLGDDGMLHEHAEISQGTLVAAPGMAIIESVRRSSWPLHKDDWAFELPKDETHANYSRKGFFDFELAGSRIRLTGWKAVTASVSTANSRIDRLVVTNNAWRSETNRLSYWSSPQGDQFQKEARRLQSALTQDGWTAAGNEQPFDRWIGQLRGVEAPGGAATFAWAKGAWRLQLALKRPVDDRRNFWSREVLVEALPAASAATGPPRQ